MTRGSAAASPLSPRKRSGGSRIVRKLRRANRALYAIQRCEKALIRATSEQELMNDICGCIVDVGGYRMAWVGLAEDDPQKTVRAAAWSGREDGYLRQIGISWADNEAGRGPVGKAIRTGKVCFCRNTLNDPAFQPWRQEAAKRGYAAAVVLPLMADGRAFGALGIYSGEVGAFDATEVDLLKSLADDLAYGICALRNRQERQRAEADRRRDEERTRAMLELLQDAGPSSAAILRSAVEKLVSITGSGYGFVGLVGNGKTVVRGEVYSTAVLQDCRMGGGAGARDSAEKGGMLCAPLCQDEQLIINDFSAPHPAIRRLPEGHVGLRRLLSLPIRRGGSVVLACCLANKEEPYDQSDALNARLFLAGVWDVLERRRMEAEVLHTRKLEAVGQLAGGVAHEFNNILAVLIMQFELMMSDRAQSDPLTQELNVLHRLAMRGAALTRQLLIFGRRQEFSIEAADLNEVVEGADHMLRKLLGENINLAFARAPGALWVEADVGMIHQVVVNLCINARDAMPKGGRLSIRLAEQSPSGVPPEGEKVRRFACLEVADTGSGMDEVTKGHLFEPFFTTKPVGKGTGLGLATVHGIVTQHGGSIEVDSTPGQGTAFRVYLPMKLGTVAASPSPSPAGGVTGSEAVLVVEDDRFVREVVSGCLRRAGYRVTEACDGDEAMRCWKRAGGSFDLVFADLVLPGGVSGEELAERLLGLKERLKVLLTTGYGGERTRLEDAFAGRTARLPKPSTPEQLLTAVRSLLDAA